MRIRLNPAAKMRILEKRLDPLTAVGDFAWQRVLFQQVWSVHLDISLIVQLVYPESNRPGTLSISSSQDARHIFILRSLMDLVKQLRKKSQNMSGVPDKISSHDASHFLSTLVSSRPRQLSGITDAWTRCAQRLARNGELFWPRRPIRMLVR